MSEKVKLRPYQEKGVQEVRQAYRDGHRSVLLQIPTGGGKTITSGHILGGAAERGNVGWFICNRVELVKQTMKTMDRLGIRYGVIAAGFTPDRRAPVQICSIDTVRARLTKVLATYPPPKLVVWDECRSIAAASWSRVMEALASAIHLGLDATPIRTDGTGLGRFFTYMVCGPSYTELMALGALVPFRVLCPGGVQPDLSGVKTERGEFNVAQVEDIMDKPTLVGDVVSHYLTHAKGKRGITFAVSVKHSKHLAEQFNASGVPAMHLDGEEDKTIRERAVSAFRRGDILQLVNVNLFSAGFDVPGVEVISDVAPTQSLSMFLQRAGRGSRPDEDNPDKKSCLLLDHAGNVFRHGLPDEDREWTLEGRVKRPGKKKDNAAGLTLTVCEGCFMMFKSVMSACPHCGKERKVSGRAIQEVDGQLIEMTAEELKAFRSKEVKDAKTLGDLQKIADQRGYGENWARHTLDARRQSQERHKDKWRQSRAEAQFNAYVRR